MHGNEGEAAFLVEAEGVEVVVGSDEPEAGTVMLLCYLFDGLNKSGAGAVGGKDAIDSDNFAVVVLDGIGDEASGFVVLESNEARESVRVVDFATGNGDGGVPLFLYKVGYPFCVLRIEGTDCVFRHG